MAKKNDDPFAYLQELIAAPRTQDPYATLKSSLPVKVSSNESAKQILSRLGTLQSNRAIMDILGKEEEPKTKRGIVSALLDPEKGLLFAPARAGSALIADVTGIGERSGFGYELSGNPIESAIRAARGEFAITGGDILKVKERDNLLTRGGKLLGALAWDITTDPTSYLGGVTSLSRRSLIEQAANIPVMKKVLKSVDVAVANRGLSRSAYDDITKNLVSLNRNIEDGTHSIASIGRGKNRTFNVVRNTDGYILTTPEVEELAAQTLSTVVSEGFITRGRAGILDNLKAVLDTKNTTGIAQEIFEDALPRELSGGLWLVNPLTGKRYKRLAGGRGQGNVASELINAARFKTARGTRSITGQISGEYGPVWEDAMRDLHKNIVKTKGNSRTLLSDYIEFKHRMSMKAGMVEQLATPVLNFSKQYAAVRQDIEKKYGKKAAEVFQSRISHYAYELGDADDQTIVDILARSAETSKMKSKEYAEYMAEIWGAKAAGIFKYYRNAFAASGIEMGTQRKYLPLMFTPEAIEYLMKYEAVQGADPRLFYTGQKARAAFEADAPRSLDDIAELLETQDARLFDSPMKANERAREIYSDETGKAIKWFEDDIEVMLARYAAWASNRLATERIIRALERTGVVRRYADETFQQINATHAEVWLETARSLDATNRAKLKELAGQADETLRALTDRSFVIDENRTRAEVLAAAQKRYDAAVDQQMRTYAELVQVEKYLRDNNLLDDDILNELINGIPDVDRAILERVLQDIKNAQKKSARAHKALETAVNEYKAAKKARTAARKKVKALQQTGVDPKTGKQKKVTIPKSVREELEFAEEEVVLLESDVLDAEALHLIANDTVMSLKRDRDALREAVASADAERVAKFKEIVEPFLAAMDRKHVLTAQVAVEREARIAARRARNIARLDVVELNSKGITVAIAQYTANRAKFKEIAYRLSRKPRDQWTLAEKREFGFYKAAVRKSRRKLAEAVGYSSGTSTAGREYGRLIMKMAQEKSNAEVALARFMSNDNAIDEFVRRAMDETADNATRIAAIDDLMKVYGYLRKTVTPEELDKLSNLERRLFLPGYKDKVVETISGPPTAKVSLIKSDLKKARARKNTAEIKRLNAELKRIQSLTDKEGVSLVGAASDGFMTPQALRGLYAPSGVRKVMERMYRVRENPDEWQRFIRDFYDPLAFLWKTQATVGRGFGYIFNNLVGGTVNNYIYGVSIEDNWIASKMLRAFFDAQEATIKEAATDTALVGSMFNERVAQKFYKALGDLKIDQHDATTVLVEFMETGAWFNTETVVSLQDLINTGLASKVDNVAANRYGIRFDWQDMPKTQTEKRFRAVVDAMLTNPMQRYLNDLAQKSEVFVRLAAFVRGYRNFGNTQSALSVVYALHFDYKDLTNFEQWIKRFVPFYTWNRYNIPLQMRAMFFQPDKIKRLVLLNENFKKAFEEDEDSWLQDVMPEWVDVQGGFLSKFKFMDNPIGLFPRLPIYDIDKVTQISYIHGIPILTPRVQQFAGMLGPVVSPLEFMVGVNFDTGIKYSDEGEKWSRIATNLAPMWGTITRAGRAATVPLSLAGVDLPDFVGQERGMTDLLNLTIANAGGYSAFTYTEKQLMSGLLDTLDSQNEQVKRIAAEANIDLEWLRKQIKSGKSLAEIRMLIAQGKGNAQLWSQIRTLKGQAEPARDYQALLSGLRGGQVITGYSSPAEA